MSTKRTTGDHSSDRYYVQSHDPHTSIPDWVPFCRAISPEARNLIAATLVLQRQRDQPTRGDLAHALGVDERTIYRWLSEIQSAGAMTIHRLGRRRDISFHRPIPDHMITDHMITDHVISDRPIRYTHDRVSGDSALESLETAIPDRTISDRAVGGGGSCLEIDSPTNHQRRAKISPHEISTDTGRWLVAEGFSRRRAHQFQDLPLAAAQADYQRLRQLGKRHGGIVETWEISPPTGASGVLPAPQLAGEISFDAAAVERYRAMGFKLGSDLPEGVEQ